LWWPLTWGRQQAFVLRLMIWCLLPTLRVKLFWKPRSWKGNSKMHSCGNYPISLRTFKFVWNDKSFRKIHLHLLFIYGFTLYYNASKNYKLIDPNYTNWWPIYAHIFRWYRLQISWTNSLMSI
jgi:hypothetical protein